MILSYFRIVVAFWTAMFWHIRQEKTYFAGKVLNFYQRNLIQNPSWSHNNSQEPWNIKSNILFLSFIFSFLMLSVLFSTWLVWMWITNDSVFVIQGGGNDHILHMILYFYQSIIGLPWYISIIFHFLVIEMKQIVQLSKSTTNPPAGF